MALTFKLERTDLSKLKTHALVVGINSQNHLDPAAAQLSKALQSHLKDTLKFGNLDGTSVGQTLVVFPPKGTNVERVILVGMGKDKHISTDNYRKACKAVYQCLNEHKISKSAWTLCQWPSKELSPTQRIRLVVESAQVLYHYPKPNEKKAPQPVKQVSFCVEKANKAELDKALIQGVVIHDAQTIAKHLGNTPPNICVPAYLAKEAQGLGKSHKSLKVTVLDKKALEKHGCGGILAVGQASCHEPRLITMEYKGGKKDQAPIVLIGKGVTFDSGGVNMKSGPMVKDMKLDMCGAASVLAITQAIAELQLPINFVGVVTSAENAVGSRAYRPGDVITQHNGKTVEVTNTDAEGRLILADALSYSHGQFKPKVMIDLATLTGAIIISLGHEYSGLYSNNDALQKALLKAGQQSDDPAWAMPIHPNYKTKFKSHVADMVNHVDGTAGSGNAAYFLSEFTHNTPWAHLDIAGSSFCKGKATGRVVAQVVQYCITEANA